ncbi:ribonuclease H-like domain-containing protein [bacterium]|nr:ribonuclease H-like domain-containing protein [bacterium]
MRKKTAYLDIETSYQGVITVIGIHFLGDKTHQLVGKDITAMNLLDILNDTAMIKTYNGNRFDLPVIRERLGVDLKALYPHQDLMYQCWKHHLKGGLKAVERQLGVNRDTEGVDGIQAMELWARWQDQGDEKSLQILLKYNREDIENLVEVEKKLLAREGKQLKV